MPCGTKLRSHRIGAKGSAMDGSSRTARPGDGALREGRFAPGFAGRGRVALRTAAVRRKARFYKLRQR